MNLFEEIVRELLTEDKESDNRKKARRYSESKGYTPEQAFTIDRKVRATFQPSINGCQGKFFLGCTRIYLGGQAEIGILDEELELYYVDQRKLDRFIIALQIIVDHYSEEYDRDLNGLTASQIIEKYANDVKEIEDKKNTEMENNHRTFDSESDYDIIRIPDSATAQKYADTPMTTWCIAQSGGYGQQMYNHYTHNSTGIFYFCLKHGYQAITRENSDQRTYDLSMIAVCVNKAGQPEQIVLRKNGPGLMISVDELESIIKMNFAEAFPPREAAKNIDKMLAAGEPLDKIFDGIKDIGDNVVIAKSEDKYTLVDTLEMKRITQEWFAEMNFLQRFNLIVAKVNGIGNSECILIDKRGIKQLDDTFKNIYDAREYYQNGLVLVNQRNLENILVIDNAGNEPRLLFDDWVKSIHMIQKFVKYGYYLLKSALIRGENAVSVYNLASLEDGEYLFPDWQPVSLGAMIYREIIPVYYEDAFMFFNLAKNELLFDGSFKSINKNFDERGYAEVVTLDNRAVKIDMNGNEIQDDAPRRGRPF